MGEKIRLGIASGEAHWNLEDYIMDLFDRELTHTDEFKAMVSIFGDKRIADIYAKFVELKNNLK